MVKNHNIRDGECLISVVLLPLAVLYMVEWVTKWKMENMSQFCFNNFFPNALMTFALCSEADGLDSSLGCFHLPLSLLSYLCIVESLNNNTEISGLKISEYGLFERILAIQKYEIVVALSFVHWTKTSMAQWWNALRRWDTWCRYGAFGSSNCILFIADCIVRSFCIFDTCNKDKTNTSKVLGTISHIWPAAVRTIRTIHINKKVDAIGRFGVLACSLLVMAHNKNNIEMFVIRIIYSWIWNKWKQWRNLWTIGPQIRLVGTCQLSKHAGQWCFYFSFFMVDA